MIEYSNLKELGTKEQATLKTVLESGFAKISRSLSNPKLKAHIKISNKGKAKRYMISLVLESKEGIFRTRGKDTDYADYDITKAAHKVINHLTSEINLRVKPEVPKWKNNNIKGLFSKFFKD